MVHYLQTPHKIKVKTEQVATIFTYFNIGATVLDNVLLNFSNSSVALILQTGNIQTSLL